MCDLLNLLKVDPAEDGGTKKLKAARFRRVVHRTDAEMHRLMIEFVAFLGTCETVQGEQTPRT